MRKQLIRLCWLLRLAWAHPGLTVRSWPAAWFLATMMARLPYQLGQQVVWLADSELGLD
jgi:hypothetical protein